MFQSTRSNDAFSVKRGTLSRSMNLVGSLFIAIGLTAILASSAIAQGEDAKEAGKSSDAGGKAAASDLLKKPAAAREKAPATFRVQFDTTQGKVVLDVTRAWSPNGADRFYNLVKIGFFQDIAFFRVIDNFMVQFGIHGDPSVSRVWKRATIPDDRVVQSNTRGMVSFAKTGRPNSRTTQMFINFSDNVNLDQMGFSPFARVSEGMDVVDKLYKVGEGGPRGPGPNQQKIQSGGNRYLKDRYPKLDYIREAKLLD